MLFWMTLYDMSLEEDFSLENDAYCLKGGVNLPLLLCSEISLITWKLTFINKIRFIYLLMYLYVCI